MKLSIIIPVYNERDNVESVIHALQNIELPNDIDSEIIVVDDGSSDGTIEIVKRAFDDDKSVLIHSSRINFGKGTAIRIGLTYVTGDIVIIQDADLEYDVNDIPGIIEPIVVGKAAVVYGSRFLKRKRPRGMQFANWFANKMLTWAANILYGISISDEATCYKAFRADVILDTELACKRFEFCPEVTGKVSRRGYEIEEIPIEYEGRSVEEGKKIRWTDGLEAIWTLLMVRLIPVNSYDKKSKHETVPLPKTRTRYAISLFFTVFLITFSALSLLRDIKTHQDYHYVVSTADSLVKSRFTSSALSSKTPAKGKPRIRVGRDGNIYSVYEPLLPVLLIPVTGIGFVVSRLASFPYIGIALIIIGFALFVSGVFLERAPPENPGKIVLNRYFVFFTIFIGVLLLISAEVLLFGKAIIESGKYIGLFKDDSIFLKSAVSVFPVIACSFASALIYLLAVQQGLKNKYAFFAVLAFVPASYAIWYITPYTRDVFYLAPFLAACWFALRDDTRRSWLWAGAFFSIALAFKLSNILLLSGFIILAVHRASLLTTNRMDRFTHLSKRLFFLLLFPAIAIILNVAYNYYIFGTPNSYWLNPMQSIGSIFTGLFGFLFSPGKSVFIYAPIVLLLLFAGKELKRTSLAFRFIILGCAIPWVLFHSLLIYWHGEGSWGPRYLLTLVPLATVLAVSTLPKSNIRRKLFASVIIIIGILINLPGILIPVRFWGETKHTLFEEGASYIYSEFHIYNPNYFLPLVGWKNITGYIMGEESFELGSKYDPNKTVFEKAAIVNVKIPVKSILRSSWPSKQTDTQALYRVVVLLISVLFFVILAFTLSKRRGDEDDDDG